MKILSSLVMVLLAVGCAHNQKFTVGQDYTLQVGTYVIATNIGENASLYNEYCKNGEVNDQVEEACSQLVLDSKEYCENIQYDFLQKIVADQESYDFIENSCKEFLPKK